MRFHLLEHREKKEEKETKQIKVSIQIETGHVSAAEIRERIGSHLSELIL